MTNINTILETAIAAIDNTEMVGEKTDIQNNALDALCVIDITSENRDALRNAVYRLDMIDTQGCDTDGFHSISGIDSYEDAIDIAHGEWMED